MGWTSFNYTETNHKNFKAINAYELCYSELNKNGYRIEKFFFQRSRSIKNNHVCYLVINHPDDYNFILVLLINISDNEIYFKEVPASFGPTEDKCPIEFLKLVKTPNSESHEYDWFIRVLKNNIKFKNQLVEIRIK